MRDGRREIIDHKRTFNFQLSTFNRNRFVRIRNFFHVVTGLTGDNLSELTDVLLAYNNSAGFVAVMKP